MMQLATVAYVEKARTGGFYVTAPLLMAEMTVIGSILSLLAAAAFAGDAAARDAETRLSPLLFTTPLGKSAFLAGRFLAALLLNAALAVAVQLGVFLALTSRTLEPSLSGPFRFATFAEAYLTFGLPNAFVTTACLFAAALLTRRSVTTFLVSVVLFALVVVSWQLVATRLGFWQLGQVMDPFGLTTLSNLSLTWTPAAKSVRSIPLDGTLLMNRFVWLLLSTAVLGFAAVRFGFTLAAAGAAQRGRRSRVVHADASSEAGVATVVARAAPIAPALALGHTTTISRFNVRTRLSQTGAIAWEAFRGVALSWSGLLLVALLIFLVLSWPTLMEDMGTAMLPTTEQLTRYLGSPELIWMIIPLFTVYYAGELVWRERDARVNDLTDTTPVPDGAQLAGRVLGLGLILVVLQAIRLLAGIFVQARLGYYNFEVGLYLRMLFGVQLVDYLLFAVLAVVVHVLVNQKYAGHLVVLLVYGLMRFAGSLGVEHNLAVYASDPGLAYSDMRGFDPYLGPFLWFKAYWSAWAFVLLVLAGVFAVRGREQDVRSRLRNARRRLTPRLRVAAAVAVGLVGMLGGFIFYNTNVLNAYRTTADQDAWRAEYERRYGRYKGVPQPMLNATTLRVELHPADRRAEVHGTYQLVNRTAWPIDTIHVATATLVSTSGLRFNRAATPLLRDDEYGHRSFKLAPALQPGDSVRLDFEVRFAPTGFVNGATDASVAANGTYIELRDWLPSIGYQTNRELGGVGARRQYGLATRPAVRALADTAARTNVAAGRERIALDVVVGTVAGQLAVAPGGLRRTWNEGARTYYQYATDVPIRNDVAIYSAKYIVRDAQWKNVAIQIVHHPRDTTNVDRMVRSVQASLEYFTTRFGPYPHRQLRMVEYPGRGNSLHSAPVNIAFREGFALFNPGSGATRLDFPFAVVAHEVAHQWWGNQLTPASVEGAPLLTESLAWYSAMGVVEATYGAPHLAALLAEMRSAYLVPGLRADVPLVRATDWLSVYRRGPFAMYALREYVGASLVDQALRTLLAKYGTGGREQPTALDLHRELRGVTPDSLAYLLDDLFLVNTFWDVATEAVSAERAGDGRYRVTLDVRARKVAVDSTGSEEDVSMNDFFEIGVYGRAPEHGQATPLYLRRHRVRSGTQRITVTVPEAPASVGIDPRTLLIDPNTSDNRRDVPPAAGPRSVDVLGAPQGRAR